MIITISGMPGSGKSTVGRMLAKKLGYKFYSMGDFYGEIAMERGLKLDDLLAIAEKDETIDRMIDDRQRQLGKTDDNLVIDSLLGHHFIPGSFKIFLDVDPKYAGQRVFQNQRPDEPRYKSPEEAAKSMARRVKMNDKRYLKHYGRSYMDRSQFDLAIDTTDLTPEQVVNQIRTGTPPAVPKGHP